MGNEVARIAGHGQLLEPLFWAPPTFPKKNRRCSKLERGPARVAPEESDNPALQLALFQRDASRDGRLFVNLYWDSKAGPAFRDHNFNYFLERLTQVPEAWVSWSFAECSRTNSWEPEFAETFEFTLSERACESFLRSHPTWPVVSRDYYLSKLFQFLKEVAVDEAMKASGKWSDAPWNYEKDELYRLIAEGLDDSDDVLIPHLRYFDWFSFQREVLEASHHERLPELLSGSFLTTHLKAHKTEHPIWETPERSRRQRRRKRLLDTFLAVVPDAKYAQVYKAKRVDERDFRRWRDGELDDDSDISQRLEAGFKEAIDKALQSHAR